MRTNCYRLYPVDVSSFPLPCVHACVQKSDLNIIISSPRFFVAQRVCKYIRAGPFVESDSMRYRRKCELNAVGPPIFIRLCFDSPRLCGKLTRRALADSHGNSVATPVACACCDGRVRLKCDVRHLSTRDATRRAVPRFLHDRLAAGDAAKGGLESAALWRFASKLPTAHSTQTFPHGNYHVLTLLLSLTAALTLTPIRFR